MFTRVLFTNAGPVVYIFTRTHFHLQNYKKINISAEQLLLATMILRHRIVQPSNFDTNIISPINIVNSKLEDHFGRLIGFLSRRQSQKICFILFGREDLDSPITCVFIYYMRAY